MITLFITLIMNLINPNLSEQLYAEAKFSELDNFNSFIRKFEGEKPFFTCSDEHIIISNLVNLAHKTMFDSLYSEADNKTSKIQAQNIFEALDKKHLPSSLHYSVLIAEALKSKGYDLKYFKLFNHFGLFYKGRDIKKSFYWSILSHRLEGGFVHTAGCFVDIFNQNKIYNIDGKICAVSEDVLIIEDFTPYIEEEILYYKRMKEAETKILKKEEFKITEYFDNPEVSIYFQGLEFIDKDLRTLVNSYVKADRDKISYCLGDRDNKMFLNFSIKDAVVIFDDDKFKDSKICLEDAFNTNFIPLLKEPYDASIVGLF